MCPLDTVLLLNSQGNRWKKLEEAVKHPDRVVAQVMNIGDYDGNPKSWAYWHYRLDLSSEPDDLPPMPQR